METITDLISEDLLKTLETVALPAATATALSAFIEQANQSRQDAEKATKYIKELEERGRAAKVISDRRVVDIQKLQELKLRESEIKAREDSMALALKEVELKGMKTNMENMTRLVDQVFGHPGVAVSTQTFHGCDGLPYDEKVTTRSIKV